MPFLKKEWKSIVVAGLLIVATIYLFRINDQIQRLNDQTAKLTSTLDSVESIVLTTDSGIVQMGKKVGDMESDVNFIVQKVRRR